MSNFFRRACLIILAALLAVFLYSCKTAQESVSDTSAVSREESTPATSAEESDPTDEKKELARQDIIALYISACENMSVLDSYRSTGNAKLTMSMTGVTYDYNIASELLLSGKSTDDFRMSMNISVSGLYSSETTQTYHSGILYKNENGYKLKAEASAEECLDEYNSDIFDSVDIFDALLFEYSDDDTILGKITCREFKNDSDADDFIVALGLDAVIGDVGELTLKDFVFYCTVNKDMTVESITTEAVISYTDSASNTEVTISLSNENKYDRPGAALIILPPEDKDDYISVHSVSVIDDALTAAEDYYLLESAKSEVLYDIQIKSSRYDINNKMDYTINYTDDINTFSFNIDGYYYEEEDKYKVAQSYEDGSFKSTIDGETEASEASDLEAASFLYSYVYSSLPERQYIKDVSSSKDENGVVTAIFKYGTDDLSLETSYVEWGASWLGISESEIATITDIKVTEFLVTTVYDDNGFISSDMKLSATFVLRGRNTTLNALFSVELIEDLTKKEAL